MPLSACFVSRAVRSARRHEGRPSTATTMSLSVSKTASLSAGGWAPSTVRTLPLAWNPIGAKVCFGSAFGVTPPSSVRTMFSRPHDDRWVGGDRDPDLRLGNFALILLT